VASLPLRLYWFAFPFSLKKKTMQIWVASDNYAQNRWWIGHIRHDNQLAWPLTLMFWPTPIANIYITLYYIIAYHIII
jgi:hypothetical protein